MGKLTKRNAIFGKEKENAMLFTRWCLTQPTLTRFIDGQDALRISSPSPSLSLSLFLSLSFLSGFHRPIELNRIQYLTMSQFISWQCQNQYKASCLA